MSKFYNPFTIKRELDKLRKENTNLRDENQRLKSINSMKFDSIIEGMRLENNKFRVKLELKIQESKANAMLKQVFYNSVITRNLSGEITRATIDVSVYLALENYLLDNNLITPVKYE